MFVALSKPYKNPLKLFLDGARNSRFVPNPKQIEITDNKNFKKRVQEKFVTCLTFVNDKAMRTVVLQNYNGLTFSTLLIIIFTVAIDAVLHQLQLTDSVSNFIRYTV